ncbi:hypothetical protein GCM10027296_22550 [Chitinimonas naiadis]
MILAILQHTPTWVFILFAVLCGLGFQQTRPRTVSQLRASILPLIMLGLSFNGIVSSFGNQPEAYALWLAGVLLCASAYRQLGWQSAQYLPESRSFSLPGSWVPLSLMLVIFLSKYVVTVTLIMQPALRHNTFCVAIIAVGYGLLSGLFLARAVSLWQLARATRNNQQLSAA